MRLLCRLPHTRQRGRRLDERYIRWFPLPRDGAFEVVLDVLAALKFRTIHCDPGRGWVLADVGSFTQEVALFDVLVVPVQPFGVTVSLTAQRYWRFSEDKTRETFNRLAATLDQWMRARAQHLAQSVTVAESTAAPLATTLGRDVGSRAVQMRRPRPWGAVALVVLNAIILLLPSLLQDTLIERLVYYILALPFIVSVFVLVGGQYRYAAWMIAASALVVGGLFFFLGGGVLALLLLFPAYRGASKATRADVLDDRWRDLASGSASVVKAIEIEHK